MPHAGQSFSSTFRDLGGEAQRLQESLQQSGGNFDGFGLAPGGGKTLRRPKDAANRRDRVAEGRLDFVVPRGGMWSYGTAPRGRQFMRPNRYQRV